MGVLVLEGPFGRARHAARHLRLTGTRHPNVELSCVVEFGLALLKGEKLDWAVQKLTDRFIHDHDQVQKSKEQELLEV